MKSALGIIISREYLERVKRKSFIITTLLMPLVMLAMMVAPALIAYFSKPEKQIIAVIDDSGLVLPRLQNEGEISFRPANAPLDSLKGNEDYEAILVIGRDVIEKPSESVNLFTHSAPSITTESYIARQIENAVEDIRIANYNIDNLRDILESVQVDVTLKTFRLDESDEESATSSMVSYAMGILMMFILYMFILLYGQMVMTSIIEEKNNRVLELVVSSVKPNTLMLGKILGIGAVAITQVVIWVAIIAAGSIFMAPFMSNMAAESNSPELTSAMSQLTDFGYIANLLIYMTLFLIGGYLLYSSIFAAIGSAVDNIQDASQLQSVALIPVIIAFIVSMTVVTEPNTSLALWTSMIPFTSPMVMMSRIPFGIPAWQPLVSVIILFLTFFAMIWVAAKIYRVGIFMYGKKPTFAELIRWTRYK